MTGCDPIDEADGPPLGEEPEASLTARLLQISLYLSSLRHVTRQIPGQAPHEGLVTVGGNSAQAVIHVQNNERPVMHCPQSMEEEDAVRAAGDGHAERTASDSQPVQRRCDRVEHVTRRRSGSVL